MSNPLSLLAKPDPVALRLALRPREAAAALGVSARTLWAWTAAKEIPHVRRGKTVLYPVSSLVVWLEEQIKAPTGSPGGAL